MKRGFSSLSKKFKMSVMSTGIVVSLALSSIVFPISAYAGTVVDNPQGETVDTVAAGDTMANNGGIVNTNEGTITNNEESGSVNDNDNLIVNNYGDVVNGNDGEGTVTNNYVSGTVDGGTVTNNYGGTVTDETTVTNSFWRVILNSAENMSLAYDTGFVSSPDTTDAYKYLWVDEYDNTSGTIVITPGSGFELLANSGEGETPEYQFFVTQQANGTIQVTIPHLEANVVLNGASFNILAIQKAVSASTIPATAVDVAPATASNPYDINKSFTMSVDSTSSSGKNKYSIGVQEQGTLARLAFKINTSAGWKEAFTFNMTVNDKADSSLKKGTFSFRIPSQYLKAGRKFAILGINKDGRVKLFNDIDNTPDTITIGVDIEGYAFALIYSD